ncbi:MAG: hypothetical protein H7225_16730 [Massilia sp.]|nr:hypothetical protein [Aquabacterium sp.]
MLIGLVVALALTAWLAFQEDDAAVEPVSRGKGQSQRAPASTPETDSAQSQMLVQSVAQWQARSALPPLTIDTLRPWASQQAPTPPPQAVESVAIAPPMAPPFPHAWVGRFNDSAQRAVLASADSTWVVSVGDVIEGQWRVDQIQERQMSLTYLPLQQRQSIAMKAP